MSSNALLPKDKLRVSSGAEVFRHRCLDPGAAYLHGLVAPAQTSRGRSAVDARKRSAPGRQSR
jgi:hypothetical protein